MTLCWQLSGALEGEVETEHMDRITILRLEASNAPEERPEEMQFIVDDGENVFHMPVRRSCSITRVRGCCAQ